VSKETESVHYYTIHKTEKRIIILIKFGGVVIKVLLLQHLQLDRCTYKDTLLRVLRMCQTEINYLVSLRLFLVFSLGPWVHDMSVIKYDGDLNT